MTKRWLEISTEARLAFTMGTPVGPSLQVMLVMADLVGEVTVRSAEAVWKRWFSSQRFYRKLAQFESLGWVEREPGREGSLDRVVRLTEAGRVVALGGRDPAASWGRSWDGRWRLVLFDIPERHRTLRTRLSRGLRQLGFGYLQNSVWVSPDPAVKISELMNGIKLDVEMLTLIEGRPCGGESDRNLVDGAWDFPRINRDYEVYLDVLGSQPARKSGRSWKAWIDVEWKAWNRALRGDPLLPLALLPPGYRGRDAWKRRTLFLRKTFGQDIEDQRDD